MNLRTYLTLRHNILVKRAGIGTWVEDNISRPVYDALGGAGAYNRDTYIDMSRKSRYGRDIDYAKTNPNISKELAARANNYRNHYYPVDGMYDNYNVPVGSEKYMPANVRRSLTENVEGSVVPKTNKGAANVTKRKYSDLSRWAKYDGVKIQKPKRLAPRKRSLEDYYGERKARLTNNVNSARRAADEAANSDWYTPSDALKALNSSLRLANTTVESNKQIEQMDAELARRQQWRQQQAQQRKQRAQQQRAQYRAQRQQQPM